MNPILSRRTLVSSSSEMAASEAPSTRTSPDVGRSRPPMRFRSVDFPDPDGPTIDTISPRAIDTVTASSAMTCRLPSNRFVIRSRSITLLAPPGRDALDASRASKSDRHLALVVDDDGNAALAFAVGQHPFQVARLLLDVDVL